MKRNRVAALVAIIGLLFGSLIAAPAANAAPPNTLCTNNGGKMVTTVVRVEVRRLWHRDLFMSSCTQTVGGRRSVTALKASSLSPLIRGPLSLDYSGATVAGLQRVQLPVNGGWVSVNPYTVRFPVGKKRWVVLSRIRGAGLSEQARTVQQVS